MHPLFELKNIFLRGDPEHGNGHDAEGQRFILEDLTLSIPQGSSFGIGGHSGSGKTSLLKMLVGLLEPDSGEILFQGTPTQEMSPQVLRRQAILVFQVPTLLGPTVLDDLLMGLKLFPSHEIPQQENLVAWGTQLLARVHLDPAMLVRRSKSLSVGEAQRVSLARALALKPATLLLDEPTASLDNKSRDAIELSLKELSKTGIGLILVSHEARQMAGLTQTGVELEKGGIIRRW